MSAPLGGRQVPTPAPFPITDRRRGRQRSKLITRCPAVGAGLVPRRGGLVGPSCSATGCTGDEAAR
jgi:hypothetical protein